jgi:threonine/homoserine/homoserine lactone efflux protein
MAGISVGFPAMLFAVGLGLGAVFERYPGLHGVLRYVGAALLLWVAWRIGTAGGPERGADAAPPLGFWQAAAFQWANPKAWVLCLSIAAQFLTGTHALSEAAAATLVAFFCAVTSSAAWAGFGTWLRRWLTSPARLRLFNWSMAALVALGVVYILAAEG